MGLECWEGAILDMVFGQGFANEVTFEWKLNEGKKSQP